MKISKSKRQLAQLLIEAGVKQFPEGASWVAQDSDGGIRGHEGKPKWQIVNKYWWEGGEFWLLCRSDRIANFHQTILSRAEFDHIVAESAEQGKPDVDGWIEWKGGECPVDGDSLVSIRTRCWRSGAVGKAGDLSWEHRGDGGDIVSYRPHKPEQVEPQYCESVTRAIPEPVTAPTLDQIVAETHTVDQAPADPALDEVREEAEEPETIEQLAAKYRDAAKLAWIIRDSLRQADNAVIAAQAALVAAGKAHGLSISVELVVDAEMRESEPVITDWRDLRVGDVIQCIGNWERELTHGLEFEVTDLEPVTYCGNAPIRIEVPGASCPGTWGGEFRFIRRP